MTEYFMPLFPQTTWEIQRHIQFNTDIISMFWTVCKVRAQRECFIPSLLVEFTLVSHLFPHGYPVSIILLPNKALELTSITFLF